MDILRKVWYMFVAEEEEMTMENKLLEELYGCFYVRPKFDELEREVEECHKALIAALEKPERKLVLRIIDAQDSIIEQTIQKVLAVQKIRPMSPASAE